ncbi:transposase family protein [Kitasatospora sp. NPDC048286]|uniref:transposase family protein n=1 Tax=Kitasatospora sp. NPDC048286 TaxID=3364047 RepID=UPI0037212EA6
MDPVRVRVADLLFPGIGVEVEEMVLGDGEVRLAVRSVAAAAVCPGCGRRSSRLHCYYRRRLADRPVAGRRVRLDLRVRRLPGRGMEGRPVHLRHQTRPTAADQTQDPHTLTRSVPAVPTSYRSTLHRRARPTALDGRYHECPF